MSETKSAGQLLEEKLKYKKQTAYEKHGAAQALAAQEYCARYADFLNSAKTEREAVRTTIKLAQAQGFREYSFGMSVCAGDKLYYNNRGKGLYLFVIGTQDLEKGILISAAHIDSPRVDLKANPLYEAGGMGFFKTHYYGGIKKYQWTALPLALHGIITTGDGVREITLGEDADDPVLYINDLLPHLGRTQNAKPLSEGIEGEELNLLVGSLPYDDDRVSERIKLNLLSLLNEKYGIKESDFLSAELSAVPALKARDVGLDRSLIAAYGHDDKVCAYPSITAMFEVKKPARTIMTILADKEETGSCGSTGMRCSVLCDIITELSRALGKNERIVRASSMCLSADVSAAYDPNFAYAYEINNSPIVNCGVAISKFTGARGKSDTNDASGEYVAHICGLFDRAGVVWQTAEMGKVDQGGGGTVAKFIAEHNIDTVDVGVAVISMHAPYEVVAKSDVYNMHKALLAFFNG